MVDKKVLDLEKEFDLCEKEYADVQKFSDEELDEILKDVRNYLREEKTNQYKVPNEAQATNTASDAEAMAVAKRVLDRHAKSIEKLATE